MRGLCHVLWPSSVSACQYILNAALPLECSLFGPIPVHTNSPRRSTMERKGGGGERAPRPDRKPGSRRCHTIFAIPYFSFVGCPSTPGRKRRQKSSRFCGRAAHDLCMSKSESRVTASRKTQLKGAGEAQIESYSMFAAFSEGVCEGM